MINEETKAKVGRPTKYLPSYCDLAEAILAQDKPLCEVAAFIGVDEETIIRWRAKYPEFSGAVNRGRAKGKSVFMENVRNAAWDTETHKVNNGLITLLAINKYKMTTNRSDNKNKNDNEHSGSVRVDGIKINLVKPK